MGIIPTADAHLTRKDYVDVEIIDAIAGAGGFTLWYADGVPTVGRGQSGDWYVDTATKTWYSRSGDVWSVAFSTAVIHDNAFAGAGIFGDELELDIAGSDFPVIPINKGGTGANTVANAITALGLDDVFNGVSYDASARSLNFTRESGTPLSLPLDSLQDFHGVGGSTFTVSEEFNFGDTCLISGTFYVYINEISSSFGPNDVAGSSSFAGVGGGRVDSGAFNADATTLNLTTSTGITIPITVPASLRQSPDGVIASGAFNADATTLNLTTSAGDVVPITVPDTLRQSGGGGGAESPEILFDNHPTLVLIGTLAQNRTAAQSVLTLAATPTEAVTTDDFFLLGGEVMDVQAINGLTFTCARGQRGTDATSQAAGTAIYLLTESNGGPWSYSNDSNLGL